MTLTSVHASAASPRGAAMVSANAQASAETATVRVTVVCVVIVRPPVEWRAGPLSRGPADGRDSGQSSFRDAALQSIAIEAIRSHG